jgi:hypothetical protein
MSAKTVFARNEDDDIDGAVIGPHSTCFLDNNFYELFENDDEATASVKPV